MERKNNTRKPLHPGTFLRRELQERGITQRAFAQQTGIAHSNLNEFINGKRNLNEDWALKFEKELGIAFQMWMNMQNGYNYKMHILQSKETVSPKSEYCVVTSRIPQKLQTQVAQMAGVAGLSMSAFIRQALEKLVIQ